MGGTPAPKYLIIKVSDTLLSTALLAIAATFLKIGLT